MPKPPTILEREARINFAIDCLTIFRHRSEIIQAVCLQYNIKWRQAERIISQGRRRILEQSQKSQQEHVLDAYNFLMSIVTGPYSTKDRLAAQRQLSNILGLNKPIKHEFAGIDGAPLFATGATQQVLDSPEAVAAAEHLDGLLLQRAAMAITGDVSSNGNHQED